MSLSLMKGSLAQPEADDVRINSPSSNTTTWSGPSHELNFVNSVGEKRRQSESAAEFPDRDRIVRRRISRACDQCNQLKRKCDGQYPCACCLNSPLSCSYTRVHKKRGRISKKGHEQRDDEDQRKMSVGSMGARRLPISDQTSDTDIYQPSNGSNMPVTGPAGAVVHTRQQDFSASNLAMSSDVSADVTTQMQEHYVVDDQTNFLSNDLTHDFHSPLDDIYSVAFMGKAPVMESPNWLSITPTMFASDMPLLTQSTSAQTLLRFPVLQPLVPHLQSIMPVQLACDLLEQYFVSSTSSYLRPSNPYVLGYILRKSSILHPTHPRRCTPALLASLLWVMAQTSDAPFLTTSLDVRTSVCQKLLKLVIGMLGPLAHTLAPNEPSYESTGDAGLQDLVGYSKDGNAVLPWKHQIDNLVTYIHLATVVSASERKASSLRWWNAAWLLARDLRLGREMPYDNVPVQGAIHTSMEEEQSLGTTNLNMNNADLTTTAETPESRDGGITEEDREERRRTWWLLYMMDRHLALCFNRPMFFANRECENLLQPLDDTLWQEGHFEHAGRRSRGLNTVCVSHGVFGHFLPLMVILGEIVDLNHARNRPRLGPRAGRPRNYDDTVAEITEQLEIYGKSLDDFETEWNTRSEASQANANGFTNEESLQTKTVVAYGRHIMHVLHILVAGKWDPIALLEDNDFWISSPSFVTATEHAVAAARAVSDIINYDPDLSFMPFFFGIYLLQGSFLLLLFADRLGENIDSEVVYACETLVRAHEACISTLGTQYQRNFRKVMRSALQQVTGRMRENPTEQRKRRREVLRLYRWTGDGTGLAL